MGKYTSKEFDAQYPELSQVIHDCADAGVCLEYGLVDLRETPELRQTLVELVYGDDGPHLDVVDRACDQAVLAEMLRPRTGQRIKSGALKWTEAQELQERWEERVRSNDETEGAESEAQPLYCGECGELIEGVSIKDVYGVLCIPCTETNLVQAHNLYFATYHAFWNVLSTHCDREGSPPPWIGTPVQQEALGDIYEGLVEMSKKIGIAGCPGSAAGENIIVLVKPTTQLPPKE